MPLTGMHFPHLFVRAGSPSIASCCWHMVLSSMCGKATVSSAAFSPFVDRYKAQNFPGNSENITILNISPVEAEVHFSFENDKEGETFLLDPPSMTLQPDEQQVGEGQVEQAP